MGLSHLMATGDEASPDPIAVAREGTLWVSDARRSDRCRPSIRASQKLRQNSKNATLDTSRLNRDFLYPE